MMFVSNQVDQHGLVFWGLVPDEQIYCEDVPSFFTMSQIENTDRCLVTGDQVSVKQDEASVIPIMTHTKCIVGNTRYLHCI